MCVLAVCFLFAASAWNKKWKKTNENVKYEHRMWSRMLYRTIDFVLFACKRPRGSQGLAPGLSLKLKIREKLCINKNHSYKHNEQINKQNIDNSECFGVTYVKIYSEMTSQ
jgi:hypothetical protein